MVGGVYIPLEWDRDDGIPGQGAPHSDTDVGCVGEVGMRGVPGIRRLVSVPVGGAMGRSAHHSKRAAPDSDSMRGF